MSSSSVIAMPFNATATGDCSTRYKLVRRQTEVLCQPLQYDDFNLQASAEVSPTKWHLAHTTWFFEYLLLREFKPGYVEYDSNYAMLFNSYYLAGPLAGGGILPRAQRGLLSRPTLDQVLEYRHEIDMRVLGFLEDIGRKTARVVDRNKLMQRLVLGLHHEQQHQELLLTDIKFNFSMNPLQPIYIASREPQGGSANTAGHLLWHDYAEGFCDIGSAPAHADATTSAGASADTLNSSKRADNHCFNHFSFDNFCFDNETPRHRIWLQTYALADRLISNGEYLEFMADGGYVRPEFWLADGWACVQKQGWQAPLYWQLQNDKWHVYTLHGLVPLQAAEPVHHVSYYEADAFARWAKARLPTEAEWENAAARQKICGHFIDDGVLRPRAPCAGGDAPRQLYGDAWEWTASSYLPYPGFQAAAGAVGEYNGKFMCNQMVLRGGSCVTAREHIRPSYRNFFYPTDRWQFSGIRLAQ